MGKRTDYDLSGWGPNGRFLSAFEKEEIQDLVFDEGVDDYGCNHSAIEPEIMSFGSDYFGAYDDVRKALSGYASRNPEMLLELEYICEDDHVHQMIRFKGNEVEEHDRIEAYPPFSRLVLPNEANPLPVLEFHFDSIDGSPETSILVLLASELPMDVIERLEDSISSFTDNVSAWSFEQLIHDVLSADGIGHWILKPTHTIGI
ncbi:MAG: hypothetical protein IJV04_06385 [Lachnospiraceae bacterium]|nr:hypothetical protein [Clostridia bacterium]MBQ8964830.1 hypothetical protein [Clostridia bacterium]MBQ9632521.1 hypothetical protein [Lachnospiraceae bacterium]